MTTSLASLPAIRTKYQSKRIVLALGSFDIIHTGHIEYLEWAKRQGDMLVVTLKSDEQIAAHKGTSRPIIPAIERERVVAALKPVDFALIGAEGDLYHAAIDTAKALHPDVVVLGPDWGPAVLSDWKADLPNTQIVIAPTSTEHSTTRIINKILKPSL